MKVKSLATNGGMFDISLQVSLQELVDLLTAIAVRARRESEEDQA